MLIEAPRSVCQRRLRAGDPQTLPCCGLGEWYPQKHFLNSTKKGTFANGCRMVPLYEDRSSQTSQTPLEPPEPPEPPKPLPEPSLSSPRALPEPSPSLSQSPPRCLPSDASSQMPPPRCLLPDVSSQMPSPRCLPQMPSPRCLLPDASSQMPRPRCFLPDASSQITKKTMFRVSCWCDFQFVLRPFCCESLRKLILVAVRCFLKNSLYRIP